jgi:uncharacterized protein (TIGR03435 family)
MFQSLLAERFKLKVRKETKITPMFALVLARNDGKLGPRLRASEIDCTSDATPAAVLRDPVRCSLQYTYASVDAHGRPLAVLITLVKSEVRRVVVDETGLAGAFDFDLHYNRGQQPDSPDPSLSEALQQQLGLRLEDRRGPVDTFAIDHVEQPTPD